MGKRCTVCHNPNRAAIDEALLGADPLREVLSLFTDKTSIASLCRHRDNHLPAELLKAREARQIIEGDNLLAEVRRLYAQAWEMLDTSKGAGDYRTAIMAAREIRGVLELLVKMRALAVALQPDSTLDIRVQYDTDEQIMNTLTRLAGNGHQAAHEIPAAPPTTVSVTASDEDEEGDEYDNALFGVAWTGPGEVNINGHARNPGDQFVLSQKAIQALPSEVFFGLKFSRP